MLFDELKKKIFDLINLDCIEENNENQYFLFHKNLIYFIKKNINEFKIHSINEIEINSLYYDKIIKKICSDNKIKDDSYFSEYFDSIKLVLIEYYLLKDYKSLKGNIQDNKILKKTDTLREILHNVYKIFISLQNSITNDIQKYLSFISKKLKLINQESNEGIKNTLQSFSDMESYISFNKNNCNSFLFSSRKKIIEFYFLILKNNFLVEL